MGQITQCGQRIDAIVNKFMRALAATHHIIHHKYALASLNVDPMCIREAYVLRQ